VRAISTATFASPDAECTVTEGPPAAREQPARAERPRASEAASALARRVRAARVGRMPRGHGGVCKLLDCKAEVSPVKSRAAPLEV
jgi:hypothetical protein